MTKMLNFALCLFVLVFAIQKKAVGAEYIHVPGKRPVVGIFQKENGITIGDVGHEANFCKDDSPYICFRMKTMAFAVPKKLEKFDEWTHEKEVYRIVQSFEMRGVYPVWVIEKTTGLKMWFVWSSYRGLLMFGEGSNKNQEGVYMLDGFCGFAASEACDRFQKK
ncbi:hypothetical protein [Acidovorax sp. BLS4]|uniref:hypothetical protein n=1 Tax=Acidovorax sp. BLS4 TaxID=3273430 RepID=UPI002941BC42|nr:hypothetical protein [Paracidovorax avenae]WOI45636.1 hypothetical protein R1Z03_00020 [Paracidovorax avenae]